MSDDVEILPPGSKDVNPKPKDDAIREAADAAKASQESITQFIREAKALMPDLARMFVHGTWAGAIQFLAVVAGGLAVLGLCFFAGARGEWQIVEKIAIPVLAFFGGLLAGRGK